MEHKSGQELAAKWGEYTTILHCEPHEKPFRCHTMPITQTSTFYFDSPEQGADAFAGRSDAKMYSRIGNPTVENLELVLAKMEHGVAGIACVSGMAAVTCATLPLLKAGDHMVACDTMYGPCFHLFQDVYSRYGIETTVVDTSNPENVAKAMKKNTKIVYVESPANPTCKISDLAAIKKLAGKDVIMIVDSTFASPIFQKPLDLGCDIVLHSLTKYINGHGDVVGGIVVTKDPAIAKIIRTFRKDTSNGLAPFDAFLVLRGLKTLPIRMALHHTNAMAVAQFLLKHPKVTKVMYPGLPEFPNHEVAKKQMTGYGSTFSFCLKTFEAAKNLLKHVNCMTLAVSLGNVDTLIEHPASMTHASVTKEAMAAQGLTPELVRISVGLENIEDLIADLDQALAQIQKRM